MVTIKEIAEELGVSTTTVSNVIHGKTRKMSAETRKKIEEALVRYHYVADYRTEKETEELKFILVSFCLGTKENILMDPFCGEMLGAIEKELHLYHRNVWYDSSLNEDELIRKSQAFQVEGVLVLGQNPKTCEYLAKCMPKPVVFIDSEEGAYDNVSGQSVDGARSMAEYLLSQGHEKIAFFCDERMDYGSTKEKLQGVREALEAVGKKLEEKDIFVLPEERLLRSEIFRSFVPRAKEQEYTVAFFCSDYYACEAMDVFSAQGLKLPEELSVTGFDDNPLAKLVTPRLTTIRQYPSLRAKEAVKLLMKRIRGEAVTVHSYSFPLELIVRESVKNRNFGQK